MKKSLFSAIVCWLIVTAQTASAQIDLSFSFVSPTCNGYTNGSATVTPTGGTAPYTFSWGNGQSGQTNIGIGAGVYTVTVMDANSQTTAGEVTVMEPAPVVATITGTGVSCDGNSGLLTAAALGGVQPFTYHWSTQATTQSIPVTGPNNFFVTVSDANDCADVATITIANPLAVDVVVTNIPCASAPLGGAVNAVISGGAAPYSILWNDNNTNASRQNLPAGTYSVTITDANNCTAVDQGTILIPPALSVVAVAITPSCGGANNGSATVVPSGGTPPYTHTWTPGGFTGSTATGLAPGQYYVCTFDANQCQVDLWVIIPEITSLDVSLSVLSAECTGVDDGVVTAFVNPPGNYEYQWNLPPFHGVNQLTGLAANTFVSVTVTDPVSGCTGTASTTVSAHNAISVAVTDTDIPCAGQNIGTASANATGGTPDYQYVWLTPPTGPQIGVGPNISGLAPGAYLVSVTDSRGCTAIGVADIGIVSGPIAAIGGLNTVTCGATESVVQFVNLSTDPFGTIASWVWTVTTPNDTLLFSNISPIQVTLPVGVIGTAQLVVTSANGCVAIAIDTFTVPGIPDISISTGPMAMDCKNGPVDLIVNGGNPSYTYVWSPLTGLTLDSIPPNAVANPSTTTTYQLIASDQGCMDTVSVTVIRITPIELSVENAVIETCDSTVVLLATSNVSNVIWIGANGTVLGNNPVTVVAGATAIYTAIATDPLTGCVDSLAVSVTGLPNITLTTDAVMMDCDNLPVNIIVHGGSPSLTYVWSPTTGLTPGATPPNVIADPAVTTTYQLIASNEQGCNDTVSVTVIRVIPIELSVENEVIETCDSTVVLLATSNVSNVIWIDADGVVLGNNPVTVVAGATAIYTAIATDTLNGCVDSLDVSVTGIPNITLTTDAVMNDCDNLPVHITVHGGSPSLTYVWSPMTGLTPGTTPPDVIADPAVTTTYQLIASNDKGCNDTVSVTIIRVIPIELSVENEVIETCDSTVLLLATSNVSNVIWVDANGVVLGNNPVTVVAGATAIYTAIATDTLNGCVDSLDVSVTGIPNITLTTDAVAMDCDNLPVHITVHGGSPSLTYVWSPMTGLTPGTTPPDVIADPAVTTTYQLIASNDKGCNDTVSVTIIRVIPIELTVENEVIETCDSTVLLLATSNVSNVIWVDANGIVLGNNPVTVVAGATAIYTAIATDTLNGCVDSLDVSVTGLPAINLTAEPTLVDCNNAPVNLIINGGSPSHTYVWSPLTGLTPGIPPPNAVANPTETTTYQLIASSPQGCQDTVSITVVRVIPIVLTVDQSVIETCDSTVLLTATANVTNVIWVNAAGVPVGTPPTNPVSVTAGATTTYTAIATDAYGCADSTTISVTGIGTNVNVDPNMPGVGCTGADIQLGLINNNPSDILQYQWTVTAPLVIAGATTATPIVSGAAGSYNVTVTVTNQYNCSETLIIPLQIDEMMSIEQAITADLCTGKIVKFFNNSGVQGLWNFGDTQTSPLDNPTHAYAEAGIYNVTFTPADNVCIMPWDSTINVQEVILEAPGIANNYVNCIDSAEIIFNGTSNNPNVSWSWTFSNGNTSILQNPVVTITEEGVITATLTVTDPNGCTTTSVLEDVPVMFIDDHILEQLSFCADTSIELNADGVDQTATYLWTSIPADANLIPTDKNPTVSPAVETVYSVTISQGPLCTVTYQVTVTPKEGANLQLPPDMVVCNDNLVSITASGNGISYEWSTSLTFDPVLAITPTVTITPIKDGIYYVRTTNLAGCSALDSIKVNNGSVAIQPEPFDGDICAGEVTQLFVTNLDADDVLSFNWSPTLGNVPNPEVSPNQETTYHVVVTNQYGCSDELDFLVNVSIVSVVAEITGKDTICPGMSTTLLATASGSAAPFTFEWSPATGLSDATIPNPVATPEQEQTYTVTVTNSNGCTSTDEVTIYFISGQCVQPYIFVPKAFTPNNDANNDFFIVRGVNITELVFIVWDRWGEKVYETTDPAAQGWDGTFNGKELTPDSYAWYLRATCGNGAVYESKGDVTLLK